MPEPKARRAAEEDTRESWRKGLNFTVQQTNVATLVTAISGVLPPECRDVFRASLAANHTLEAVISVADASRVRIVCRTAGSARGPGVLVQVQEIGTPKNVIERFLAKEEITVRELAGKARVHEQTIYKIYRGVAGPDRSRQRGEGNRLRSR